MGDVPHPTGLSRTIGLLRRVVTATSGFRTFRTWRNIWLFGQRKNRRQVEQVDASVQAIDSGEHRVISGAAF